MSIDMGESMARPRGIPGLGVLLSQLPEDVRSELKSEPQLFVAGFVSGWLRCALLVGSGPPPPESTAPEQPTPRQIRPVPRGVPDADAPPPPAQSQEPPIGHWTPSQVAEVVGFACVNSTDATRARLLAVKRLRMWDGNHADLPGSWAAQLLNELENAKIKREPTPDMMAQSFDAGRAPSGEFGELLDAGQSG